MEDQIRAVVEAEASVLRAEYATTDPALEVVLEPAEGPETVLPAVFQAARKLNVLYQADHQCLL